MHIKQAYDPFRALGSSWGLLKRAPWLILLATALFVIAEAVSGVGFQIEIDGRDIQDWRDVARRVAEEVRDQIPLIAGLNLCLGIPAWLFLCWLRVGFARALRRTLAGGKADVAELFAGGDQWGAMVLATLLRGLLVVASILPLALIVPALAVALHGVDVEPEWIAFAAIGVAVLYSPIAIYVLLGLALAPMAVAFEGMQATEALSRSWEIAKGRRWTLFLYFFVLNIVEIVGAVLCCCCGLGIVVFALTYTACFESYAQLVGAAEPPPPQGAAGVGLDVPLVPGPVEPPRAD